MSPTKKEPCESRKQVLLHGFFLLMVSEIAKPTKSKTQVTEKNRSLDVFWISLGLLNGYDKYQELSFPTDCGESSGEISFCEKKMHHPTMAQLRFLFCRGWKLSSRPMNSTKTYQKNLRSH